MPHSPVVAPATRRIAVLVAAPGSGLLLALLFAPFGYWPLGWVCLVPLLWAVAAAKTRLGATLLGFCAGLVFWVISIPWVVDVMTDYGGMPWPAAVGALLLLAAYLSLYPATVAFLVRRPLAKLGPAALFLVPFLWVAGELLLTHLLTGFPWNLLGYSQVRFLPAAQIADLAGVYGVSFLLVAVNCAVAFALLQHPVRSWAFWRPLIATAIAAAAALAYGYLKLGDDGRDGEPFTVAMVQDDLTNAERMRAHRDELFLYYWDSTRAAAREGAGAGADMVMWAEGSLLFVDMDPPDGFYEQVILALARDEGIWLLIGSNDYTDDYSRVRNAAFSISPDNRGAAAGRYHKVHLTPFGEYVPYQWALGWVPQVVMGISDFEAGRELEPIPLRDGSVGVAICYEIIFPDLVRRFTARGAGLLATVSNDAWSGHSASNDQHFDHAIMRAIENRRYLVRCAVTGVSGAVAPDGHVLARTAIYKRDVAYATVAMRAGSTVYMAVGDLFAYLCAGLALLSLAWLRYTKVPLGW